MSGPDVTLRPQPVGVFPLPAGFLLLPAAGDARGAPLGLLLTGDASASLPEQWRFYALALHGDVDSALLALASDDSPLAAYNRFVLHAAPSQYQVLRRRLEGPLAVLLDVVAYTVGQLDEPPPADGLDAELRGMALLAQSSYHIERDDPASAMRVLREAVDVSRHASPVFAAQLLGQLAALGRSTPGQSAALVLQQYREAIRLAADSPLSIVRAELWLNLGVAYQEMADGQRGPLLEAVKAYQEALHCGLSIERHAELYALAHGNLGLAYLSMPMTEAGDALRMGVAVQSFRESLKVYTRETYPDLWSSVQLNLANALQYLPSSHPEDNLVRAVELYEEVMTVRNKAIDPVGYARLLANQANALGHLGMFAPALEKVSEAYKLFHWHNEPELATSTLDLVHQINQKLDPKRLGVG